MINQKKIRIAQIGTSRVSHGNSIWASLVKQTDLFEVAGYAFPENERVKFPQEVQAFNGYQEMTVKEILNNPEIEAVAIETEEIYLTKYALMAAEAGKHVHMEKPGGTDLAEFKKLINTLKSKKLSFSIGYMFRFHPTIQEAISRVQSGELGRIYSVEAQMSCLHSPEIRQWLKGFPGGNFFFLGCHLIDLIYRIQGEPMEIIPLTCSTEIGGIHTQDYGMAVYKYPGGVSFAKTCDTECGGNIRRQLVICGEKGTIEIKPLEVWVSGGIYSVSRDSHAGPEGEKINGTKQSALFDRYDDMMRNFAELVRGKENPYSYDYELHLYELILKSCGAGLDQ